MLLKDKVAIVTGGAQGMGRAIALKYAENGCSVVVADLNQDGARETAAAVEKTGARAIAVRTDITDSKVVGRMVDSAMDAFGRIDILVNNAGGVAGTEGTGNSDTITEQEWDRVVTLNLKGPFLVTLAVLQHMKKLDKGKIIFVSSMGAVNPAVSVLHYHSAKAGILGFAKNLAFELAPRNIHVNTIVPGPIETTFWDSLMPPGEGRNAFFKALAKKEVPMERMGKAEDIAGAALFLASGLSDYVTGQTICVAGGQPLLSHGAIFDVEGFLNRRGS
jgi:NAD(P)-dependent dehydrogenase (short-subunit alcohol dehydrogenase family)